MRNTYQEQFCLVYIRITCSIWYFIQFVHIAIFMSLHGPAGACILVASGSPIDVPPIQHVLKHCGAHKHIYKNVIQNNLSSTQLAGEARQLGVKTNTDTNTDINAYVQRLSFHAR